MGSSNLRWAGVGCVLMLAVGCAVKKEMPPEIRTQAEPPKRVGCKPAAAGAPLIGTWYAVSRPRGVGGDLQALTVLAPDGTMTYETQLKIGGRTRPALRESGCWSHADGVYTLHTTQSNGEPVEADDPIYVNRYKVEKIEPSKVTLRELKASGQVVTARKMSAGYRLPR